MLNLLWSTPKYYSGTNDRVNPVFYKSFEERIYHVGTPHEPDGTPHSGAHPWGSGENPYQRATDFRSYYNLKIKETNPETGKKYTTTEIARAWGISSTEARHIITLSKAEEMERNVQQALYLKSLGLSNSEAARRMGVASSTFSSWLVPNVLDNVKKTGNIADYLKEQVEEKKYLDVGTGVEAQINISKVRLKTAIKQLTDEGYKVSDVYVEQATNPRQKTRIQVLTKGDVEYNDILENVDQIRSPMGQWTEDDGLNMRGIRDPVSVDSSRIMVRYSEDGGNEKDGVIEIRPGVEDLSLGQNHYAQVRIAVDNSHYLKGMAIYSQHVPDGYDIVFNTNKHVGTPMCGEDKNNTVLKNLKDDQENPFGATIRQFDYFDADGNPHQSPINIVNTDEDWDKWQKSLSSQFLSKQSPALAKQQLAITYDEFAQKFDAIKDYPNTTIRKKLLDDLAEECDSAAVNLKAAALPRQDTKVLIPCPSLKDNEVYAPTYEQGEEVVLIRFPHGGKFEIPRVNVNNENPEGKEVLGNSQKAIGINSTVAGVLSGADFDGDTSLVIPTRGVDIQTMAPLKALENFDPKEVYKTSEKVRIHTQKEMGVVTNLVNDMTIKLQDKQLTPEEREEAMNDLVKAVRHSMVVIDAEKHNLDYRQSEKDNDIQKLKEKYQTQPDGHVGGPATLISRKKKDYKVVQRDTRTSVDPETGKKVYYKAKGATWIDKNTGEEMAKHELVPWLSEVDDAYDLVSRDSEGNTTLMESIYADHSNKLKALANQIRKTSYFTPNETINRESQEEFKVEIASLKQKLRYASLNAPKERLAQAAASKQIKAWTEANPGASKKEIKKVRQQVINATRKKAGAASFAERKIVPTDSEWEAIVANVFSKETTLSILKFMDAEEVLSRTNPVSKTQVSNAAIARAKALLRSGYTWAQVANAVGISESTLRNKINS